MRLFYDRPSSKDRKNSAFTKAAYDQFPQRLLIGAQAAGLPDWRQRNIELLFSFCSDFVHSGYVSVLAIGEPGPGFVMGGSGDAFTPKAENFAELKLRLLAECAGAYADLFLPILRQAMGRMLVGGVAIAWIEELDRAVDKVGAVRAILHRELVEPVRRGLIGSDTVLHIKCMCGGVVELDPPHQAWDRYCHACGSRFVLHEVSDQVDYVISSAGIGDILGGDATRIADLDQSGRDKLLRIAKKHAPADGNKVSFLLITDLERCDEDTLGVASVISSAPNDAERSRCSLMAFVAAKSMGRCPAVRITCRCGGKTNYQTADQTNVVQCRCCHTGIGLLSVTGDGKDVPILNPDGSRGMAPIQGKDRFTVPGIATG